jgi:hypothetical protein
VCVGGGEDLTEKCGEEGVQVLVENRKVCVSEFNKTLKCWEICFVTSHFLTIIRKKDEL